MEKSIFEAEGVLDQLIEVNDRKKLIQKCCGELGKTLKEIEQQNEQIVKNCEETEENYAKAYNEVIDKIISMKVKKAKKAAVCKNFFFLGEKKFLNNTFTNRKKYFVFFSKMRVEFFSSQKQNKKVKKKF